MTFNKKLLAGLVALAAASSAQAVTVAANDGWTLGVSGSVNQFMTYTSDDTKKNNDQASLQDGLLPAFINFDFTAPTMNGLDIAAHISFSPSTSANSYAGFEQREVYFTVAGGFGQILAGKALGLYGAKNILTDQTLFGVGYGTGEGDGTTTLGGIGLGYDYASWRSQVKWTSNDMNGFKLALAVMDPSVGQYVASGNATGTGLSGKPTGSITTGGTSSDNLRYEAELSYAGAFDGGSYSAWLSGMTQDEDNAGNNDTDAYSVGGTLAVGGFEAMAQYSDASSENAANVETEWNQYLVQAGYRFGGTTLVSAQYAELENDSDYVTTDDSIDKITVGVYHDVNANLKLIAEYTQVEDDNSDVTDTEIFSVGGFVFF
ncbi:porin [Pseudomonadota bacterium]|nr:porin [Pseudomonadota bacterium]